RSCRSRASCCPTWSGRSSRPRWARSPCAPAGRSPSCALLEVDRAVLHGDDEARHRLARHRHAGTGAQVELPAVERARDDVALDGSVAEIAAGVRALVADGEDLVAAAEQHHVEAVHHRQLYGAFGEGRQVEHFYARHRAPHFLCACGPGAGPMTLVRGMLPLTRPRPPPGARVCPAPSPLWGEGRGEGSCSLKEHSGTTRPIPPRGGEPAPAPPQLRAPARAG